MTNTNHAALIQLENTLDELLKPLKFITTESSPTELSETLKSFKASIQSLPGMDRGVLINSLINQLKEAKHSELVKVVREEFKQVEAAEDEFIQSPLSRPKPYKLEVNTAQLLEETEAVIRKYIVTEECVPHVISVWVLYSWVFKAFDINPYLQIKSPVKRCGKSTLLTLLQNLCPSSLATGSITAASVFRVINAFEPTMLVDEVDTFLKNHPELEGVLNAGHSRGAANVYRCVGENNEPTAFNVYCPKVFSGIGNLKDTLEDRSIGIPMRRKKSSESVTKMKVRKLESELKELRSKFERWSQDNFDHLSNMEVEMPSFLNDRAADNWEPLYTIASLAGNHWLSQIEDASKALTPEEDNDNETLQIQLLTDISKFIKNKNLSEFDRFRSDDLRSFLLSDECEEHPWREMPFTFREISMGKIAELLRKFNIRPKTLRFSDEHKPKKGYEVKPFLETFERYLGMIINSSDELNVEI